MKNSFIAILIFFSILMGGVSYSSPAFNNLGCGAQTVYTQQIPNGDYYTVRILIDGWWWTYYYALDGSFIVAIPDDEE